MTRRVKILLHWIIPLHAGTLPRGREFSVPARFDHQGFDWTKNAWSLVITSEETPDDTGDQPAIARFLMPDAPHEWLSVGRRFTLFEGSLELAEGVVEGVLSD
jgi:hypothetical protein